MSEVFLIRCECGRRFPVNPDKHLNRDYRICPFCGRTHRKEGLFSKEFNPNPKWAEMRKQRRMEARERFVERMRKSGLQPQQIVRRLVRMFSGES